MLVSPTSPGVSVLIATLNRDAALETCVQSVLACLHPAFEVIVVVQGGEACALRADPRLRVIESQSVGKSRALNIALGLARFPVLAFTDDDCTVPQNWLSEGERLLGENPSVGLVFSALTAMPHDPAELFVPTFLPPSASVEEGLSAAHVRAGAGANMFARRALFDRIGGFDEILGPGAPFRSCEEFDLYYRALRGGFAVLRTPENPVVHWGARSQHDGSGERLLLDYWFGEAAVIAKHVRTGDRHSMWLAARTFGEELTWAVMAGVRGRSKNCRRAVVWARGFAKGMSAAVDATKQFFVETRGGRAAVPS